VNADTQMKDWARRVSGCQNLNARFARDVFAEAAAANRSDELRDELLKRGWDYVP
jgi:hypothetical protein